MEEKVKNEREKKNNKKDDEKNKEKKITVDFCCNTTKLEE